MNMGYGSRTEIIPIRKLGTGKNHQVGWSNKLTGSISLQRHIPVTCQQCRKDREEDEYHNQSRSAQPMAKG
jgi:hypothetical protein